MVTEPAVLCYPGTLVRWLGVQLQHRTPFLAPLLPCSMGTVGTVPGKGGHGRQWILCILLVFLHPYANKDSGKANIHMTLYRGLPVQSVNHHRLTWAEGGVSLWTDHSWGGVTSQLSLSTKVYSFPNLWPSPRVRLMHAHEVYSFTPAFCSGDQSRMLILLTFEPGQKRKQFS